VKRVKWHTGNDEIAFLGRKNIAEQKEDKEKKKKAVHAHLS
jgi:hypothetical protein